MTTTSGNMNTLKVTGKDGNVFVMTPVDTEARQAIDEAKNLQFDDDYFTAEVSQDQSTVSVGLNGVPIGVSSPLRFDQDTAQGIVIGIDTSAVTPAEMTGATASTDGESGLVPAPDTGDQDKYLKGDGTWANVPVAVASTSGAGGTDGLMPATDKEKLDGAKSFSAVKVTNGNVSATLPATSLNEEIELVAGDNVTLETGLVIGGRQYKTVKIGNQVWMAENLDFAPEGIEVMETWRNTTDPVAMYYNSDEDSRTKNIGLMYDWYAAKYLEDNKANLFPGWHVPTMADFKVMDTAIPVTDVTRGYELRAENVSWAGGWGPGSGRTASGFNALPGGRTAGSSKTGLGDLIQFISITTASADYEFIPRIISDGLNPYYEQAKNTSSMGYIRLVKDDSTFPNTVRISSDAALEKSTYGTYVSSEQGEAVQGESGAISVSENSVELYDTFKGVKFGAARAVADQEGNVIDETYATREGATSSEAGLMSAADKSKLDGITDYVVSAAVSGSTLTLTPKTGSAVVFTDTGETNVIESVKLGSDTLTPASKVVTIPLFDSTTNGAVTAPESANRNDASFPNGTGGWSMLSEVNNSDIDNLFGVTIGGRDYRTVIIGNQMWLAENLDYKIPGQSANYKYYNNDEATYGIDGTYKCGLLYNFAAATYLETNKATLLPAGWHVPTRTEMDTLMSSISGQYDTLKSVDNSITTGFPSGWNGTDGYGFGALPVGYYTYAFVGFGDEAWFWSCTALSSQTGAVIKLMKTGSPGVVDDGQSNYRSLRLVKTLT